MRKLLIVLSLFCFLLTSCNIIRVDNEKTKEDAVNFTKGFYQNWFYMHYVPDSTEQVSELKKYNQFKNSAGKEDYNKFYKKYAAKTVSISPDTYTVDTPLVDSLRPVIEGSTIKEFKFAKVLSNDSKKYEVGLIFDIEGKGVLEGIVEKRTCYCKAEIVKDGTQWKVADYVTYSPNDKNISEEKSQSFLNEFETKLTGKEVEKDKKLRQSIDENDEKTVLIKTVTSDGKAFQGSGFFVAPGVVATNYHVVDKSKTIEVSMTDEKKYKVDGVILSNKKIDLAVIKLKEKVGESVRIGNPKKMEKMDTVFAIGSPGGLRNTVTSGTFQNYVNEEGVQYIQSSLETTNGNSGGPLFNIKGDLIGVNTMISELSTNISFAVSVEHLKDATKKCSETKFEDLKVVPPEKVDWSKS